ncbi:hypothetical protein COV25_01495 [candidate division WWE3 bacterium CG10_big_fil_rev_8_21_14_0_10_35_32]|nr:MAG: hypothetical protein COV25_01495 [candidate division WWE3 bacterium CG10_big_fil_rev_8_21_14_0_10_35_32]
MIGKNILITAGVILVLGIIAFVYTRPVSVTDKKVENKVVEESEKTQVNEGTTETSKETVVEDIVSTPAVKEFTVESFYDDKGMWFSLKEITVNKGDTVKIKVKNIKGVHDFNIDEYGIKVETPLNEEVIIEFVADKAGEFIYYCSKPEHREKGQWGTLTVSE